MDTDPKPPSSGRDSLLAVALVVLVAGMVGFYLYLITLGIVVNVLAAGGLFILLGVLHYYVWGQAFSEEVAKEAEALRRRDEAEANAKPKVSPDAIQDVSRTQGIKPN
ncbi:MAG: hypothetical protein FJ303_12230 [Planctomycetes bacterium]|nr:hypothetical protein [Planctomycetota bacterium]